LSKNHTHRHKLHHDDSRNYSQGLLINNRQGVVQQQLVLNYKNDSELSYHYQLYVGIPGYKVGPLTLVIEYLPYFNSNGFHNSEEQVLAILGNSIQFPMPKVFDLNLKGDWQWSFQVAQQRAQKSDHKNQQAWQTSLSWLGLIPQHKLGLLVSHTDDRWVYSDDFSRKQNSLELGYQITLQQEQMIELAIQRTQQEVITNTIKLGASFSF
jgi:hypothetical protein